jgi:pimeloyl-ACP methyl ester carboxylesterase
MPKRPIVLVHGYSDVGDSFKKWADILRAHQYDVRVVTYKSLVNEISVKDIAEGFEKVLHEQAGLDDRQPFDAVVHSTGMLVLRSWLARFAKRNLGRVKHLIGLAPASFGSPLAHKGRSWLGAMFKGNKDLGPDFLNTGEQILLALELGSSFTWELAHQDLVGSAHYYGPTKATPWIFVFCGTDAYSGLRRLVNEPGTDGTVRLAGCALNAQKVRLDLSGEPAEPNEERVRWTGFRDVECPLWPVPGMNHGTIISDPTPKLQKLVLEALKVESLSDYTDTWFPMAKGETDAARDSVPKWQQFVVRALDERGDAIRDYHLELSFSGPGGRSFVVQDKKAVKFDVHAFSPDPSFRCIQLDIGQLEKFQGQDLLVQFLADTGTKYAVYRGLDAEVAGKGGAEPGALWQARIRIPTVPPAGQPSFFYPFTTTLIELTLNREVNLTDQDRVIYPVPV